jgi:hypothetical protein
MRSPSRFRAGLRLSRARQAPEISGAGHQSTPADPGSMMRVFRSAVVVLACALFADAGQGQTPTKEGAEPLHSLRSALKQYEHVEIRVSARASTSSTKPIVEATAQTPSVVPWGTLSFLYRRDPVRLMVSQISSSGSDEQLTHFQTEWILTNGQMLYVADRLNDRMVQRDDSRQLMVTTTSPAIAGPEAAVEAAYVMDGLNDYAILLGYLGYFPIAEYVGDSAEIAIDDTGELVHVDSRSSLGHLQLWLDPASGFMPRKLELVKRGADLTSGGRRVDEVDMNSDEKIWPSGGVKSLRWTADEITLGRSGDVYYMAKITLVQDVDSAAGPVVTITTDAEVDSVNFNPSFGDAEFAPRLAIPAGHPVTAAMAEHLPFQWDGKGVVPAADDLDLRLSRKGDTGGRRRLGILIVANLVLLAVVVGVFLFRRFRLRRPKP